DHIFQDGCQHGQRIAAQDGSFRYLRNKLGLGNSDGEAVANVDVQHDVDIGAAVTHIDDVVRANLSFGLELVEHRHFAITSGGASDGFNLARVVIAEFRSIDMRG